MEDGASLPSQVEAICEKSQEASGEEVDEPAVSRGATPSESKMSPIEERIEVPDGRREERRGAFLDPPFPNDGGRANQARQAAARSCQGKASHASS